MRIQRVLALVSTCAFLFGVTAYAQDSQSLGDVARQSRQQKQQKDTQAKTVSPKDASGTDGRGVRHRSQRRAIAQTDSRHHQRRNWLANGIDRRSHRQA